MCIIFMNVPSLLRHEEHKAISRIMFSGRVLDLGGDKNSEYLPFFQGQFNTTTLNLNKDTQPDIVHNLEKSLPLANDSYDHILLMNVLEHIFEYRALLQEVARVLKHGGSVVLTVPFLFPIHSSPQDYHRFTAMTLREELTAVGLQDISVQVLGGGIFSSIYVLFDRLLPRPLRILNFYSFRYLVYLSDIFVNRLAGVLGKKYTASDYALGYCAVAHKK